MNIGMGVTLYNAELMIEPCLRSIAAIFPNLVVHDFGSEDSGPDLVKKMGFPIVEHGRLSAEDYTICKQELSMGSEFAFWADADEVWPEHCLKNVGKLLEEHQLLVGHWRNLLVEEGKVYVSGFTSRGTVAWNTKLFRLHRAWPREKMNALVVDRRDHEFSPSPQELYCYHGVLLNLSTLPDKKNRWKKRAERRDAFDKVGWNIIPRIPFDCDPRVMDPPRFVWYK